MRLANGSMGRLDTRSGVRRYSLRRITLVITTVRILFAGGMQQCYQWFVRGPASMLLLPVAAVLVFCSAACPQAAEPRTITEAIPDAATARKRAESIMAKKHWAA